MEVFKGLAQDARICIANTESVNNNAEDDEFDKVLRSLQQYSSTARVVACFCEGMTVRGLLKAIRRLNVTGELLLVGSDGWADRPDVVEGYEKEAVGGLSVRIHSPYVHEFDPYYYNLHPDNNTRNPWFREFWEFKFNCSLPPKHDQPKLPNVSAFNKTCTGKEHLSEKYKQDTKMAFVMKAIYTMAYGLHSMQRAMCPHSLGLCPEMLPINGSILLQHLLNVSFVWGNDTVEFDQNGDPPGRYDIMNFQRDENNEYNYVHIGSWDSSGNLTVFRDYQWPMSADGNASSNPPESVCSKPCPKGQA
ncbi:metabotropic glutamate receptor 1-like protein 2, partial [Dinothrombium tinctorium]